MVVASELLRNRREIIYRILSIALSSIFFANIPLILFLIYMGHYGFFSYDFFSEGVFGLKVFFFLTSIFMLVTSLALFWWVIPIIEKWKKGNFKLLSFIGILIVNLLFAATLFLSSSEKFDLFRIVYVCAISFFVSIHIAFLLHAKPKEQLHSLIALIFIIIFMSLHLREQASSVLANGLKAYGVGGGIEISLMPKMLTENEIIGKLILLSPNNIYIKLDSTGNISTIDRARFDVITTKQKKNGKDSIATVD